MNEHIEMFDTITTSELPRARTRIAKGDFGPVIVYQGKSFTVVSFGLLVGLGTLLAAINVLLYLEAYQILPGTVSFNHLGLALAFGTPLTSYLITRLLDIKDLAFRGENIYPVYTHGQFWFMGRSGWRHVHHPRFCYFDTYASSCNHGCCCTGYASISGFWTSGMSQLRMLSRT